MELMMMEVVNPTWKISPVKFKMDRTPVLKLPQIKKDI